MTTLQQLFQKPIDRAIETVIKADDNNPAHRRDEVEEYVVTPEVQRKIEPLFDAYVDDQKINGVWISGFFGSGKSHMLKILSYVLQNDTLDGKNIADTFAAKIKDNELLRANIKRAARFDAETILFNIDNHATSTDKRDRSAILNVFYKVFHNKLGFLGASSQVSEFEFLLWQENKYEAFKTLFAQHAGAAWEERRRQYFMPIVQRPAGKAMQELYGDAEGDYTSVLKDVKQIAKYSPTHLAERLRAYLDRKGPNSRLLFHVDEVGQFIAEDTQLMLNLQTITEALSVQCAGRVWVVVTAQEDIEAAVGTTGATDRDDFSKIQGRFRVRIPLNSADVDAVIEARLLAKTAAAETQLDTLYTEEADRMKALLSAPDGEGMDLSKNYREAATFVRKYPFVDYQFGLFQQCIRELAAQNAFQGKHASVGERSMLGVFHHVLRAMREVPLRGLVSFDRMYEGIRDMIRGEVIKNIGQAEKELAGSADSELAVRTLKVLFLTKYYDRVPTNLSNVALLLIDSLDTDLTAHTKRVKAALHRLELKTFVERNGEQYVFLTNVEKDIENNIKSTETDDADLDKFFGEVLYSGVLPDGQLTYTKNKQPYGFNKRLDGNLYGRERHDLEIDVWTPNNPAFGNEERYRGHTMGHNARLLFVLDGSDEFLLPDIKTVTRTEKYFRIAQGNALTDTQRFVLDQKQKRAVALKRELRDRVRKALVDAAVYLNGSRLAVPGANAKIRIANAFQQLVEAAYPQLDKLGRVTLDENQLTDILSEPVESLFKAEDTMSDAEREIYDWLELNQKSARPVSIKAVMDKFGKPPYGWYRTGTAAMLARLFRRDKVEFRKGGALLDKATLRSALLNTREYELVSVTPQTQYDPTRVATLRALYTELFSRSPAERDPKPLAEEFIEKLGDFTDELRTMAGERHRLAFVRPLQPIVTYFGAIRQKGYDSLIQDIAVINEQALDHLDVIEPIREFYRNTTQLGDFKKIGDFLASDPSNLREVDRGELARLEAYVESDAPARGLREALVWKKTLAERIRAQQEAERERALADVAEVRNRLTDTEDYRALDAAARDRVLAPLDQMREAVRHERFINTLRNHRNGLRRVETDLRNQLSELRAADAPDDTPLLKWTRLENVLNQVPLKTIESDADVDTFLQALGEELRRHLANHHRINL